MRTVLLALSLLLLGCPEEEPLPLDDGIPDWPALNGGVLLAGAAASHLDLPIGVPLGGFTGRDRALGSEPGPDSRDSDYRTDFVPSGGWQTRIPLDVLWLENGEKSAVLVRIDLIYTFDGLTEAIGERLSEATGVDLTDSVFTFSSHSHSSYGTFTKATMLFFGGDFYREEIFERMVDQAVGTALDAYEGRTEAAIGLGVDVDFDPIGDDTIFRDRREENSNLLAPDGSETGPGYKDTRATMLRVDSTAGDPIAAMFFFGTHGTIMGGSSSILTSESMGHVSQLLNERHGGPVWIYGQGAGGDASPGGRFDGFARMEWIAEQASTRLLTLYDSIELSADPITLEPVQRYVTQGRDIRVTRNGTTDLHYMEWQDHWADDPYRPDMRVWEDDTCIIEYRPDCVIRSPLDEFWVQYGAALCGEPDIDIAIFGLNVNLPMYASCLDLDLGFSLFRIAFREYVETREDYPLPLPESRTTMLGALGLGAIPVTYLGSPTETRETVLAFAPGEATTLWTQFLRHRAGTEAGVPELAVVAYAMDHEGYLLTVEDWLQAGYESTISWWGPLQGEYILEQLIDVARVAHTPVEEDPFWPDYPTETWYPDWDTPFVEPDATPNAGLTPDPAPEYIFTRDGNIPTTAQPDAEVPRIQGIARWTLEGSDPATGLLEVELQRAGDDGSFAPVTTPAGTPITDAFPDVFVTYTPDPLTGSAEDEDPVRTHLYHVEWQAVGTTDSLDQVAALPTGTYRLVARGQSRDPADTDYPYDTTPWESASDPFEVVPALLTLTGTPSGASFDGRVSYAAAPRGYRLLHRESGPNTPTPLVAATASAWATRADGSETVDLEATLGDSDELSTGVSIDLGPLDAGSWNLGLDDGHGNQGTVAIDL